MDYQIKPLLSKLSGQTLIELCNEKMVCAARDLAEFTKRRLNANYIVALALKCEEFEKRLGPGPAPQNGSDILDLENDIRNALVDICETGKSIWPPHSKKFQDYLLPRSLYENLPGSSNVA